MTTTLRIRPDAITLGEPGTTTTIQRIAAGSPIDFTWPGDSPDRRFLDKAIRWAYDPSISVGEFYNLIYGPQNPLLSVHTVDGQERAVVTRAAHESPMWAVENELIDRKRVAHGHLDLDACLARFSMPVSEAAVVLGITPSAVRQLIERSRIAARKEGASYLCDPLSVAAYDGLRRGPRPGEERTHVTEDATGSEPTDPKPSRSQVKIGHLAGAHVRMKGARLEEAVSVGSTMTGVLPAGWERIYLLSYFDDGKPRLTTLAPSDNPDESWSFQGFFVRGAKVVDVENNPKRARAAFDAIDPSPPTTPKS